MAGIGASSPSLWAASHDADCFRVSASDLELGQASEGAGAFHAAADASSRDGAPSRSVKSVTFSGPDGSSEKPRLLGRPDNTVSFESCRTSGSFSKKEVVVAKEDSDSNEFSARDSSTAWGLKNLMVRVRTSGRRLSMTSMPTDKHSPPHRFPRLDRLVRSKVFETVIALVIIANCVTMGLEVETLIGRADFYKPAMRFLDNFFAVVFLIELIMRLLVLGWRAYIPGLATEKCGSVWNFLEALIVLISCATAWFIGPNSDDAPAVLQALTILRALRLVRVVRVVSRVKIFHEVWLLLRGLTGSMRVLFWTVVVIFFITYMFAVFGVVLISVKIKDAYDAEVLHMQQPPDYATFSDCSAAVSSAIGLRAANRDLDQLRMLHESTLGIWQWMFTLLQVLTLDSWMSVARPMQHYVPWSWGFFYLYIAIAVFVLMNLVTAIIVENALKSSQKDAEEVLAEKDREKKGALKRCRRLFHLIDEDQNGSLTLEEFMNAFQDPALKKQLEVLDIHEDDAREIFKTMDTGDGVLELEEFFEGITRMQGPAQAKDMFRVLQITQKLANDVKLDLSGNSSAQLPRSPSLSPATTQPNVSRGFSGASSRRARSRSGVFDPSMNDVLKRLDMVCSTVEACDRKLGQLAGPATEPQDRGDRGKCSPRLPCI